MKRKSLQMSYDADAKSKKSKANSPDQKVQNQVYCNDLSVRLVDFSSQSLFFFVIVYIWGVKHMARGPRSAR